jgi:hypothetical protein
MRNDLEPRRHDGGGIDCVAGKEQRHGEHHIYIDDSCPVALII